MSDNIPFEIQVGIIKRLPVKSVLQFRTVSKTWKSLIDSSEFITHYNGQQRLLVRYADHSVKFVQKYISFVDDHTFPQQKVDLTIPASISILKRNITIGTSHGLLCMYGYYQESQVYGGTRSAVIWNPSIRKAVSVDVPNIVAIWKYRTELGFGVCRETLDPKIVKITYAYRRMNIESIGCIPRRVEVFTLSTRAWRSPYSNLPRTSIEFHPYRVAIDGVHYWLATDLDVRFRPGNLVISFDMTSEEFREVNLPDRLLNQSIANLSIFELRESLVVLEFDMEGDDTVSHIWMMEDGFPKSFTKVTTINVNTVLDATILSVRGFKKTGEPIIEVKLHSHEYPSYFLVVYDPHSKSITNIGVNRSQFSHVYTYMETLLLL